MPSPKKASSKERDWFKEFAFSTAPVTSGKIKERLLPFASYEDFYRTAYKEAATKAKFPIRCIDTITLWLQELNIKLSSFDRYRCEVCFQGRAVANLVENDTATEQQRLDYEKFKEHHKLVQHQLKQSQIHKQINDPTTIYLVYDYSTIHEFSEKKVSDFSLFF